MTAAEVFARVALGKIIDGIHDPLIELDACVAVLRMEMGEIPDDDMLDLIDYAAELTDEYDWLFD